MDPWLQDATNDSALMDDFLAICAFGGRRSGSGQDSAALNWALDRLKSVAPGVRRLEVPYDGWRCTFADLQLLGSEASLACNPLLRSASTPLAGIEAELIDLGEGRTEDFARHGNKVQGRIVLVRHEYPFSSEHMHRRRKYDLAVAAGAAGFLIANTLPGAGVLSGSSGRGLGMPGIPAAYVDFETAQTLGEAASKGRAMLRLRIHGEEEPNSTAGVGILDIPGGRDSKIVISAHMDGHDLGQSALDNATGVAVALAAARALAPHVNEQTASLRVCFFCAEEWALSGSARYLDDMSEDERASLKLNINLDTVAGDNTLTALISDYPQLKGYVAEGSQMAGVAVDTWLPLMPNSDHANFARHGVPAFRLVAGFNKPTSRVNNILSAGDVPDVVKESELSQALAVTCALGYTALSKTDADLNRFALRQEAEKAPM
jgi:Iap family predicted aminopeptidase